MENFDKRVIVYEKQVDIEDLESYFWGFQGLVQTQSWEIAFMLTQKKKVALLEIREFYFTLVHMNKGYYKAKVNKKDYHLRLSYIAQLFGVLDDEDKTYFDNV